MLVILVRLTMGFLSATPLRSGEVSELSLSSPECPQLPGNASSSSSMPHSLEIASKLEVAQPNHPYNCAVGTLEVQEVVVGPGVALPDARATIACKKSPMLSLVEKLEFEKWKSRPTSGCQYSPWIRTEVGLRSLVVPRGRQV